MTKVFIAAALLVGLGFGAGMYYSQNHMPAKAGTCVDSFTDFVGGVFDGKKK